MERSSWQACFDEANYECNERCRVGKRSLPVGAGRPTGRSLALKKGERLPPHLPGEQVPGTTLLCLSVAAVRSALVVVIAKVKGYEDP